MKKMALSGFSLVELSIVLVILGLLTGGILAGQSLIRAAELRSISSEYSRYATAAHTFRDKYFAIPGDFTEATRFWNRQTGDAWCAGHAGAAVDANGVCNGNADNLMQLASTGVADQSTENFQFWRHLAKAGLIEGSFTGIAGSGSGSHATTGANAPASRIARGTWFTSHYAAAYSGSSSTVAGYYGNYLFMGAQNSSGWPANRILIPEELWNIDVKMDDGKPARGKVITFWWDDCGDGATQTSFDANYELDVTTVQCTPIFREAY